MRKKRRLLRCGAIAVGLAFATAATAGEPDALTTGTPEDARVVPEAPLVQPALTTDDPFGSTTAAGDPFGLNLASGIPTGMRGGQGARVGPVTVYPAVGVALRYDDNLYISNTNKKSSFATVVSPAVVAEFRMPRGHTIDVGYAADLNKYWSSSSDDFINQRMYANANVIVTSRARVRVRAEHADLTDPRGATDRGVSTEPDKFHSNGVSGLFSYGLPGAQARFELEGGYQEKRYDNNRAVTIAADRDTAFAGGAFYWRVMPRTNILVQVRHTDLDYTDPASVLDSTEQRYVVGATWEATAITTGSFRIGQLRKKFDSPGRTDFTGLTVAGDVTWSPLTYSTLNVAIARETNEASGLGDFILSEIYLATWRHAWNNRFATTATAGYREDDFRGTGATRSDHLYTAGIGFTYGLRRWLAIGGQYQYTSRSSSTPGFDYDRNILMLTVGATL